MFVLGFQTYWTNTLGLSIEYLSGQVYNKFVAFVILRKVVV